MKIGIPKERKENESRIALIPQDVKKLVESGHSVFVERNAGLVAGFSDEEYEKAGAKIESSIWEHEMIVKVKAQVQDPLKENQIFMAYLHVEKGQSPKMLKKLLEKKVLAYAFEEIKDKQGRRVVNLGYEAGIVGMYEGFRTYGKILEENKKPNPFRSLPELKKINKNKACELLSKLKLQEKLNVVVMGYGNVYRGVKEILDSAGLNPSVLTEKETPHMEKYVPGADILVNAVSWLSGQPHLVTKNMLNLMKKTALILDISCDTNGAVETCVPTTWSKPLYRVNGIIHSCIDNLPSAIAKESSIHLSSMIFSSVLKVANKEEITGLMTKNGKFVYKK